VLKLIRVAGIDGITRDQNKLGTTGQPAVVYLPSGVYIISKPLQLYVGTVLMGDPLSPPTIKAASGFNGNTMIYGKDPHQDATTNFYIGVKNLVFDSNNINKDTTFTIIDWSVSQATQLTNCVFNMPSFSSGHTGISMPEGGSGTYLGDLQINGGVVGIDMSNQQYMVKGVAFKASTTGIKLSHCFDCIIQDCTFQDHSVAIDMTSNSVGSLVVLDSSAQDVGTMVSTIVTGNGGSSLILENVQNNGIGSAQTVMASGNSNPILSGNVVDTWVMGNTVSDLESSSSSQLTSSVHVRWICLWKLCGRSNFHYPSFLKSPSERQILHHGSSHLPTVRPRPVHQHQISLWLSCLWRWSHRRYSQYQLNPLHLRQLQDHFLPTRNVPCHKHDLRSCRLSNRR
jgi:hypothetical protein